MHEGIVNWYRRLAELGEAGHRLEDSAHVGLRPVQDRGTPRGEGVPQDAPAAGPKPRRPRCATIRSSPSTWPAVTARCGTTSSRRVISRCARPCRRSPPRRSGSRRPGRGPLALFVAIQAKQSYLIPMLTLDRHVATLRVIEALRLHAAAHDGRLARVARRDHRGLRARGPGDRQTLHLPACRRRRDPPRLSGRPAGPRADVPDLDPTLSLRSINDIEERTSRLLSSAARILDRIDNEARAW